MTQKYKTREILKLIDDGYLIVVDAMKIMYNLWDFFENYVTLKNVRTRPDEC